MILLTKLRGISTINTINIAGKNYLEGIQTLIFFLLKENFNCYVFYRNALEKEILEYPFWGIRLKDIRIQFGEHFAHAVAEVSFSN